MCLGLLDTSQSKKVMSSCLVTSMKIWLSKREGPNNDIHKVGICTSSATSCRAHSSRMLHMEPVSCTQFQIISIKSLLIQEAKYHALLNVHQIAQLLIGATQDFRNGDTTKTGPLTGGSLNMKSGRGLPRLQRRPIRLGGPAALIWPLWSCMTLSDQS